jgi:hypothetical protein
MEALIMGGNYMKYFRCLIGVVMMVIVSCKGHTEAKYQFSKIGETNNLKYSTGQIEGTIHQDIKENGRWVRPKDSKKFFFRENDYPTLEKYLNDTDQKINAWFSERKNIPIIIEFLGRGGRENPINKLKRFYIFDIDQAENGSIICAVIYINKDKNWFDNDQVFQMVTGEAPNSFIFLFSLKDKTITLDQVIPNG